MTYWPAINHAIYNEQHIDLLINPWPHAQTVVNTRQSKAHRNGHCLGLCGQTQSVYCPHGKPTLNNKSNENYSYYFTVHSCKHWNPSSKLCTIQYIKYTYTFWNYDFTSVIYTFVMEALTITVSLYTCILNSWYYNDVLRVCVQLGSWRASCHESS